MEEDQQRGRSAWIAIRIGALVVVMAVAIPWALAGWKSDATTANPMYNGGPLPSWGVEAIESAIAKLNGIGGGIGATGASLQQKLDADPPRICTEGNAETAENSLGNTAKYGHPLNGNINVQPTLLAKAKADDNGEPYVEGQAAILAAVLSHEEMHDEGPGHSTPYLYEFSVLCACAGAEPAGSKALKAICHRLKAVAKELKAVSPVDYEVPACAPCDGEGNGGGIQAPFAPTQYTPAGSPTYHANFRLRELIDSIEIPADYLGINREYWPADPGGLLVQPSYIAWPQEGELWVTRWNPHADGGAGGTEMTGVALAFKPLALAGAGASVVFVAGVTEMGQSVVRKYSFDLAGDRVVFSVDGLYAGTDIGFITDLSHVASAGVLLALDASQGQLWQIDVATGSEMLIADTATVPALAGRRSLNVDVAEIGAGSFTYKLSSHLHSSMSIDLGGDGTLVIYDFVPGDAVIDGFDVLY